MIVGCQCRIATIRVYVAKMKQDYATTSRNVQGWKKVIDMRLIDADILRFYLNTRFFHDVRDKDMVCETINAQPTIDTVRKGKWIDGRCNQCCGEAYWKRGREVYGWREFALELTKYCPNCGAKMEEGGA